MDSREERIRKITGKDVKPGEELQATVQGQNEIAGINSELQNNLQMEQAAAQSRMGNNQILSQAAQMAASGMAGGAAGAGVAQVVNTGGPGTQAVLQKYGLKPQAPKVTRNTQRSSQSQTIPMRSGGVTNVKNETITNTTNNSRTEIRISQPEIPMRQQQIVVSPPAQSKGDGGAAKFKAWLSGVFAKQNNDYEVQKKEFRKREWSLNRSANRMMRRIEQTTKGFAKAMDPRRMTSTLGGQIKTTLFLIGTTLMVKYWKPIMKFIANIEGGIRTAFGLPVNADLSGNSGRGLSIVDSMKKAIGIDPNTAEGRDTTLIKGIGKVFNEGIDKLIKKIDLWLKDRGVAIKAVTAPNLSGYSKKPSGLGKVGNWMWNAVTAPLRGIMSSMASYMGDLMSAAFGGSSGNFTKHATKLRQESIKELNEGDKTGGGVDKTFSIARNKTTKGDYDALGNLKSNAGSTLAASNAVTSMIGDKSNTLHTGAVATGLEQLSGVAQRNGSAVINPDLLSKLGLTASDVNDLQRSGYLTRVKYKLVKVGQHRTIIKDKTSRQKNLSLLGNMLDEAYDIYDPETEGYYRIVPLNSREKSFDGSKPLEKVYFSLSKEGFDRVKSLVGISGSMSLKNKDFVDWVSSTLQRKKHEMGVTGSLKEKNNYLLGNYNTAYARLKEYEEEQKALDNDPKYAHWNTTTGNLKKAGQRALTWSRSALASATRWASEQMTGEQQKANVVAAMKYFIGKGFSKEQAAGIVGNLYGESGMNPGAENKAEKERGYKGYGRGIAQWSNERVKQFAAWHEKTYGEALTPEQAPLEHQLEFVYAEMQGRPVLMKQLQGQSDIAQTTDSVLRGFENGGPGGLASVEQMDRTYSRAAIANSYEKMMNKRVGYAMASLDLYEKSTGEKEKTTLDKLQEGAADALGAIANFVDPATDKGKQEKPSLTPEADQIRAEQIKARNTFYNKMYGAITDTSGTYVKSGTDRIYLNTERTGTGISTDSVSFVTTVGNDGLLKPTENDYTETAKASGAIDLADMLFSYEGKGTDTDYMTDKNGKPLFIYLGRFIPDSSWSGEALRQLTPQGNTGIKTSEQEHSIRKNSGISYTILLSKNAKRVVRILTDPLYMWINGKAESTGKELFWPRHFKSPDGKTILDWNPKFLALGVTLTQEARRAIEYVKTLFAKDYKDLNDFLNQSGALDSENEYETEIATQAYNGVFVYDNNGWKHSNEKYGADRRYDQIKNRLYVQEKFNMDAYYDALGIKSKEDLEKQYKDNPDKFYEKDGKVYHRASGMLVGSVSSGKFTATDPQEVGEWLKANPNAPSDIQKELFDETRLRELREKGLLGEDQIFGMMNTVYAAADKLATGKGNKEFDSFIDSQNRNLVLRTIGGYKFRIAMSRDGLRAEEIRPVAIKSGNYWYLAKADGSIDEFTRSTKEPKWAKISSILGKRSISLEDFGYSTDSQYDPYVKGRSGLSKKGIVNNIDIITSSLNNLANGGEVSTDFIDQGIQDAIKNRGENLRLEFAARGLKDNEGLQEVLKRDRERWKTGKDISDLRNEGGDIINSEGILLGHQGENGEFTESTESEIFNRLRGYFEVNKRDYYRKWFGAVDDGTGGMAIENGNTRVILDMDKPLDRNWKNIIKDVQWRNPTGKGRKKGAWVSESYGGGDYSDAALDFGKTAGTRISDASKRESIIKGIEESQESRKNQDQSWLEILAKNNNDVEAALQEQSDLAYEAQEDNKKLVENAEAQTHAALDSLEILRRIAENGDIDLSDMKFTVAQDGVVIKSGFRPAVEQAATKKSQEMEEAAKKASENSSGVPLANAGTESKASSGVVGNAAWNNCGNITDNRKTEITVESKSGSSDSAVNLGGNSGKGAKPN
jgi:hypothetical protein